MGAISGLSGTQQKLYKYRLSKKELARGTPQPRAINRFTEMAASFKQARKDIRFQQELARLSTSEALNNSRRISNNGPVAPPQITDQEHSFSNLSSVKGKRIYLESKSLTKIHQFTKNKPDKSSSLVDPLKKARYANMSQL